MTALQFLQAIFGAAPGFISLWRISDRLSFHAHSAADADAIVQQWAPAEDVYFGVNPRRSNLGAAKRGGKRDVAAVTGLFVDVDLASPLAHKAAANGKALPPDMTAVSALLAAVGFEPTLIVDSGYGVHAYYLLDKPEVLPEGNRGAQDYERMCLALQQRVIVAGAAMGYHVDQTADVTRVLRVPGTFNRKDPTNPKPVTVLVDDGPSYGYTDLRVRLLLPATAPNAVVAQVQGLPAPAATERPPVSGTDLLASLNRLKDPAKATMVQALLAGKSFADTERDRAMQILASVIAWRAPDNDPETLAGMFSASLAVWAAEPTATKTYAEEMLKVTDKIRRAQEDARNERARVAQEDAGIKAALGFHEVVQAEAAKGAYTTEELMRAADVAHAPSVTELDRLWVIQVGEAFYVLTDVIGGVWKYSPPQKKMAMRGLPTWLRRAPLTWTKFDKKQVVPRTVDDLLEEYATVALSVEASLTLEASYLDLATYAFHEAACPLRDLKPTFDADVHAWLEALGGADKDLLLDWVATVTDLTTPSCALYLSGPPNTGKSLLANGLARLWHKGTPTKMARVLGDGFNEDFTKCPLVFADEALPTSWNGKQTSAELRELITSNRRTLARKFLSNTTLEGCIRVMMAANNDNLLAFNEDMSPDDIKAMAERFLHIDTTSAGQYLTALGPEHVDGWVTNDTMAKHALFLRDNRSVTRAGRLAVKGHVSRIHQAIATRGTVKGLVVEWLAGYLQRPSQGIPSTAPIRAGGGQFIVNVKVVSEFWEQYVSSDKVPSTGIIGRILKGLSTGNTEPRLGGVRCHAIDVEAVIQWATETGAGEPETMRARVNQPVAAEDDNTKKAINKAPPATVHDIKQIIESKGESK